MTLRIVRAKQQRGSHVRRKSKKSKVPLLREFLTTEPIAIHMKHVGDIYMACQSFYDVAISEPSVTADSDAFEGLSDVLQEIADIVKYADSDDLEEFTLP